MKQRAEEDDATGRAKRGPVAFVLDAIDLRLLDLLATDGRMSHAALGEAVGLSGPAVYERVRKLEQMGAIRGYRAIIDSRALGAELLAFVDVELASGAGGGAGNGAGGGAGGDAEGGAGGGAGSGAGSGAGLRADLVAELGAELRAQPEVLEVHRLLDGGGLLLKVVAADLAALGGWLERLRRLPGVAATRTRLALDTAFERGPAVPAATEPTAPMPKRRRREA